MCAGGFICFTDSGYVDSATKPLVSTKHMSENLSETRQECAGASTEQKLPVYVEHAGTGALSTTVVTAVAEAAGVDPLEIGTPLYECIDPEALDDLFGDKHDGTTRGGGRVVFTLLDFDVTAYSDGHVVVQR